MKMVLVIVALIGQAQAQETSKQRDQVCAYVQEALPWPLVYGHIEINSRPLVLDPKWGAPPWLEWRTSDNIRMALQPVDLQVSPDSE
jgi:hypothetical protein